MNTAYVYSATRLQTLSNELLSQTDIDRLLVARSATDLQSALKETYLASYLLQVPDEDMAAAIEATLVEAKRLIHRIAPDGAVFRVLWVQYDIHNLRVFAKAKKSNQSYESVSVHTSARGIYDPTELYRHAEAGTLDRLQIDWQTAFDRASRHVEAGELDLVDGVFDELLFATIIRIAARTNDPYIKRHVTAVIDVYNLMAALRQLALPDRVLLPNFVSGGTFRASELSTTESVAQSFETIAPGFFTEAFATYNETGNTSELDARIDDYLVTLAKTASTDIFSSASLVSYYLRTRQAAANIRTIVVGRNSGFSSEKIRANLRTAYVNQ